MGSILLAGAIVFYNALANRWKPFHSWAYVPVNLAMTAVVVTAGSAILGLDRDSMGLHWRSAWVGAAIGGAVMVVPALALGFDRGRARLRDRRLEGVRGWNAAFMVLVRIPIGTALVEETVFRGVLLGGMLHWGQAAALAVSSVAFGLWHIVPTAILARTNGLSRGIVPAGVVLTAMAGVVLGVLRIETRSIAAPVALHATINALGALAALCAFRLPGRPPSAPR